MADLKYAAIGDEGIESPFFETEDEVKQFIVDNTSETWELNSAHYYIQGFTEAEIKKIEAQPEV